MTAVRSIARSLPVVAVVAAAVLFAPTASADPSDQRFLDALDSKGITYSSADEAINAGHDACELVTDGRKPTDVAVEISNDMGLGFEQALFLVGAAIGAYCPEKLDQI